MSTTPSTRMAMLMVMVTAMVHTASAQDDVVLDPRFNGAADIYAMAFRPVGNTVEAWLTMAEDSRDDGRRKLARVVYRDGAFSEPEVLTDGALNHPEALYDGVPAFHPCDSNTAIIVSDRPAAGSARRSNDLYLVQRRAGRWTAERLPFNSDSWDDTPCFSADGSVVYFSSDRRRPGSGRADIYMVRRQGETWGEPVLLSQLCTDAVHETSPYVSGNTLYLAMTDGGDQQIYSVGLDAATGIPTGRPMPLTVPGVNVKGADEYHAVVSPGGNWIVFSSDRAVDGKRQYRLYYRRLPRSEASGVDIRVTARTRIRDAEKVRFFGELDSIYAVATTVRVTDVTTGAVREVATNAQGVVRIASVSADALRNPAADVAWHRYVVQAVPTQAGLVSSVDTLDIASTCGSGIEHVIYVQDTTSAERTCEFTFRTFNVPFFVTTYWCPTTRKYRAYTPCTSLFTDDVACQEVRQPEPCETNEAYRYSFEPAKLVRERRGAENCVAYGEFERYGAAWAQDVDRSIEHMRDEVRSALDDACVQAAIAAGMAVDVTYIGTTDDRQIDPDCKYTGMAYDRVRAYAPHIQVDSAVMPFIATGRSFNRGGYGGRAGGNQLLSDVRSLYFAILFDNLCRETIPMYAQLQRRGQLVVRSRGQAIDRRDLPYELKRAAGVEIRVPGYTQRFAGQPPAASRKVVLCTQQQPCGR